MKKFQFAFAAVAAVLLAASAAIFTAAPCGAETFRFRFQDGASYRINSIVTENVYANRAFSHAAEITSRITMKISDVKPAANGAPASARHDCVFMTSEKNTNRTFTWGREYPSVFRRTELGAYEIGNEYFMPVVRNVPTFPERDLKPGESWTGTGEEAHDFRDSFALTTPFKVPFSVTYTYVGPVERDGRKLHLIQAEYTLFFDSPKAPSSATGRDYPVTTMGYSKQEIYFDNELGIMPHYEETFRIQLQLASGNVLEFRGKAEASVTEIEGMDRDKLAREMNDEIKKLGIKDTNAQATDDGVTISLENIQFEADSANLLPSEKEKITKIAALLERYPDKELLISGHTALAGTASSRQKLSEERASAVARFLVEMGVRENYNVYTRGFGAEKPIAPNDNETNRSRNRRVDITILEK
jgi:outer membrane protein OmpA-like peptidoglycan-associated protein